jgi:CDP-diacylglycerol--serine O-phosphatidyltransferase
MQILFVIIASVLLSTILFFWFTRAVNRTSVQEFIHCHLWLLHPNAICYWRAAMAVIAFVLYFFLGHQVIAIPIFTFAAFLDGVDGIIARKCNLGTYLGEWLDPLCDKLTYLPPLLGFAYGGILSITLVWVLITIEIFGQFLARRILNLLKSSGAANNFGKIKAIICFGLVIFCALLDDIPDMSAYAIGNEILVACIILGSASIVFKFIPNRYYADILSTLNFCCGVVSLILTYHHFIAWAICIIIMGQLFDLFDGRMAIKHGGTRYGPILDDIADFVSFGLAPAYVIVVKSMGPMAWLLAAIYIFGVAFRLVRFVVVDKKRKDLPSGIFNGLPSPAGALIVLGGALVVPPKLLWVIAGLSVGLMVSHIRFAHLGRVILKKIPRPLFFLISSFMVVSIAFVFKTKNVEMFGYLILCSIILYLIVGRIWATQPK